MIAILITCINTRAHTRARKHAHTRTQARTHARTHALVAQIHELLGREHGAGQADDLREGGDLDGAAVQLQLGAHGIQNLRVCVRY